VDEESKRKEETELHGDEGFRVAARKDVKM